MRHAGAKIRFGDEGLVWLADKLNMDPTNERLPEIAVELARRKLLLVMLSPQGSFVAVAKPKDSSA